jgi:class 3 adenylate cyclase
MLTKDLAQQPLSTDAAESSSMLPPGMLAFLGAAGSLVTCYGTIFAATVFGIHLVDWNAHLQAIVMWSFGAIALHALWRDRRQHGSNLPLVVGSAAVAILMATLYIHFERSFEILSYVLLVVAALLNQNCLVQGLAEQVRKQAGEIQDLNVKLAAKVERQFREIERLDRLREFLSPQVAELVVNDGKGDLLGSHRRYIACLFCDIRNFTALSEGVEPEEAIAFLQEYHERIGGLVDAVNGTIGFRAGDGLMIFFNDPVPCDRPVLDAVELALRIRDAIGPSLQRWQKLGFPVGIGIAVTAGYATLGLIGRIGGAGYTAIGNPVNLAARLCDQTADGEILIDQRAYLDVEDEIMAESAGTRHLKGIAKPVESYLVRGRAGSVDR